MTVLYSLKDRIKVQIEDITFHLAPLSVKQKRDLTTQMVAKTNDQGAMLDLFYDLVRTVLKKVEGITNVQGEPWILDIGDDGKVTEECMEDITNLPVLEKLYTVAGVLVSGVPKEGELTNPRTGEKIEGILIKKN